jgi:hypothetical protein
MRKAVLKFCFILIRMSLFSLKQCFVSLNEEVLLIHEHFSDALMLLLCQIASSLHLQMSYLRR